MLSRAVAVRWTVAISALACASCGSSEPNAADGGADDGEFDPIEYPVLNAMALCEPLARCCPLLVEGSVESYEGCVAVVAASLSTSTGDLAKSLEAGRSEYHERALRDCIDATKQTSCDVIAAGEYPEECNHFLVGQVPLGEYCQEDFECIDGYCVDSTCVPLLAIDDPCDDDWRCASGHCKDDDVCRPEDERDPLLACSPP